MSENTPFRCLNCGNRFTVDLLTEREKEQARRERRPLSDVRCPTCNRLEVRRGWD